MDPGPGKNFLLLPDLIIPSSESQMNSTGERRRERENRRDHNNAIILNCHFLLLLFSISLTLCPPQANTKPLAVSCCVERMDALNRVKPLPCPHSFVVLSHFQCRHLCLLRLRTRTCATTSIILLPTRPKAFVFIVHNCMPSDLVRIGSGIYIGFDLPYMGIAMCLCHPVHTKDLAAEFIERPDLG